ncbi:glycerol-3-phosphate responsive antiterminator [Flaviflexus equikiangi]|uniref:Glycerol-3-phosphate responsive antiterminator n=1 Tax=Flaviflexus equikiangi TaxID=2758573 RepID=A0ABS2TF94_9ACTO|nr:glycerol-3-phosphate responsive antiterminator [Flaviflexus equikiangi]MBM9433326.1 glycerol-3-phosphate responsive antiterminator [Flaviflexus equikiangi]
MIEIPERTVIPSVRHLKELETALDSTSPYVLLTNVHIGNLEALAAKCIEADHRVLVHCDLIGGFKPDREGIRLLKNMFGVSGVFTQSAQVVSHAQKAGMLGILRVFIMDSRSLEKGIQILTEVRPDGIEVLPGALAHRYWDEFEPFRESTTLIAGGMIVTGKERDMLFDRGYRALTASSPGLWDMA